MFAKDYFNQSEKRVSTKKVLLSLEAKFFLILFILCSRISGTSGKREQG
jgi:hypothetical protein